MPLADTCCGVVRASINTLASAAVFAAESQPSTSYAPSPSVIPMRRASASPSSKLPPRSIVSITTFEVEFNTPVKPSTFTPGMVWRHRLNTGAPSITLDSKRKPTPARAASSRNVGVRMRDRPLVGRHHVHPARQCGANVPDRRFAGRRIERRQFHRHVRPGGVQKFLHRGGARTELRRLGHLYRQSRGVRRRCRAAAYGFP